MGHSPFKKSHIEQECKNLGGFPWNVENLYNGKKHDKYMFLDSPLTIFALFVDIASLVTSYLFGNTYLSSWLSFLKAMELVGDKLLCKIWLLVVVGVKKTLMYFFLKACRFCLLFLTWAG